MNAIAAVSLKIALRRYRVMQDRMRLLCRLDSPVVCEVAEDLIHAAVELGIIERMASNS